MDNGERQLENITYQLEGINKRLGKTSSGKKFHWPQYLFLGCIAIILAIQSLQIRRVFQILDAAAGTPEPTQPQITQVPTGTPSNSESGVSVQGNETTPPSEADEPEKLLTLLDWMQTNTKNISVVRTGNIGGLIPVTNGYIVHFTKDELETNSETELKAHIEVIIHIDSPSSQVQTQGCFIVRYNDQKVEVCDFNLEEPVLINLVLPFAVKDDGKTTVCDAASQKPLGRQYYREIKTYRVSIEWADAPNAAGTPFAYFDLTSNFAILNKASEALSQGGFLTNCEAVIVDGLSDKANILKIYRLDQSLEISAASLDLSDKLRFWLGLQ